MIKRIIIQSGYSWMWLIGFAFLEGIFRPIVLEPQMSAMLAGSLGIAMVLATGAVIAFQFLKRGQFPQSTSALLMLGGLWAIYTIALGFLYFHFVTGLRYSEIIENCHVSTGHLFPIGLAATVFVPLAAGSVLRARALHRFSAALILPLPNEDVS